MNTAKQVIAQMESLRNEKQREVLVRFFKTREGEYGQGDEFLGLKVPQTRAVVNEVKDIPLGEVPELLVNRWHEVRLCGLLVLVAKFEALAKKKLVDDPEAIRQRDEILTMYLDNAERANNWDLVDLSAPKILGRWMGLPTAISEPRQAITDRMAFSDNLWKQRISMVFTWMTSRQGDPSWCLRYAEIHLNHPHDLMHKATGWMLREMGKNVSMDLLRDFLRQHVHEMPRTTLRYAIEKMPRQEQLFWLKA